MRARSKVDVLAKMIRRRVEAERGIVVPDGNATVQLRFDHHASHVLSNRELSPSSRDNSSGGGPRVSPVMHANVLVDELDWRVLVVVRQRRTPPRR